MIYYEAMSQWTHVNGSIRIDSIRGLLTNDDLPLNPNTKDDIKKVLGPMATHNTSDAEWESSTMPKGSEGGLRYSIYEEPDKSHMAAFVVSFWGDLRDFPGDSDYHPERTTQALLHWFENICKRFSIRQAMMEINTNSWPKYVATYQEEGQIMHVTQLKQGKK